MKLHKIKSQDAEIEAFSIGQGEPIIFLHGGPGDTHHYMHRMAEPLLPHFQCIFFDQRGTGGSQVFKRVPEFFSVSHLFEDLIQIVKHFELKSPSLVGHSWGAMYGLYACIQFPELFKKAALLNMGPLDLEMGQKTSEHLVSVLNSEEKQLWKKLRQQRNEARDRGETEKVNALDKEIMQLRVHAWVYNPNLRQEFLADYFQDPPPDREVNKWIWESSEQWFSWDLINKIQTPLWLCVGENDSVPVAQAQKLNQLIANSELSVFSECGHIPWLEHREIFYQQLIHFLK